MNDPNSKPENTQSGIAMPENPLPDQNPNQNVNPVTPSFATLQSQPQQSQASSPNENLNPELPPQNQAKNVPTNEFITPASVTMGSKGGGSFGKFVVIGVVIIAIIYAVVGYLYLQNEKFKNTSGENTQTPDSVSNQEVLNPTPVFSPENFKIVNGNVVYQDPVNGAQTIVDKSSYSSTGITGFAKVTVSPDASKLCFESWPPAPKPALFISKIDGSEISEINGNRRYCVWTTDSKKIVYENTSGEATDILIYDNETKAET